LKPIYREYLIWHCLRMSFGAQHDRCNYTMPYIIVMLYAYMIIKIVRYKFGEIYEIQMPCA